LGRDLNNPGRRQPIALLLLYKSLGICKLTACSDCHFRLGWNWAGWADQPTGAERLANQPQPQHLPAIIKHVKDRTDSAACLHTHPRSTADQLIQRLHQRLISLASSPAGYEQLNRL